jgi:hypothetical protein
MNESILSLITLYENTLSSAGYGRRECDLGVAQSQHDRLEHVRFMLDEMRIKAAGEKWSAARIVSTIGFVQGILWAENFFTTQALADQRSAIERALAQQKIIETQPMTAPVTADDPALRHYAEKSKP